MLESLAINGQRSANFHSNIENTRDWTHNEWTVSINLIGSKLVKFANQPVQFTLGGRYCLDKPNGSPDWGVRFGVTFLFPIAKHAPPATK